MYKVSEELLDSLKTVLEDYKDLVETDPDFVDSTRLIARTEELIKLLEEEYYIQ